MGLKLPAIRSKMGIWVYYVSSMSFLEVSKYVKPIDDELHKSDMLSGMIQRSITDNYKSIASYLETQEERFFNALILAVYDGRPVWNEVHLEDSDGEDNYNLGLITLSGEEKIFPVDGQHRVAGVKKALETHEELADERVPVIFIGHSKDEVGMQRARRMFSTLNRYAKPVSLRDIIALDEDDVVAIASRELLDNTDLFPNGRILDSKNKSIPANNIMALTNIITYYECNKELLWYKIKDIVVYGMDGNAVRGRSKIKEYIRHRPPDKIIYEVISDCREFWTAIIDACPGTKDANATIEKYRNGDGGHLFFRPISLVPFARAIIRIKSVHPKPYNEIIASFPRELLWIQNRLWKRIIWDDVLKKMVMGNSKLIELILLYIYDRNILTEAESYKIIRELQSNWNINDENQVKERLNGIIMGEEYV